MEWEAKIEMCRLGQEDDLEPFKQYVTQHIDSLDVQAWDMFITVMSISVESVQKHGKFLQDLRQKLGLFDHEHGNSLSMRTNVRLGMLIDRIEKI